MSTCPQCQTRFDCGVVDTGKPAACWCMRRPRPPTEKRAGLRKDAQCLCPRCLERLRAGDDAFGR